MKTKKAKPTVTRICIARLFNTGNYEHVRYEVTAEVPSGASAKDTLLELGAIVSRLRPVKIPYEYERAKEVLNKLPEAMTETEKDRLEEYRKAVGQVESVRALRLVALAKLDDLGGSSKKGNAKADWRDDDEEF